MRWIDQKNLHRIFDLMIARYTNFKLERLELLKPFRTVNAERYTSKYFRIASIFSSTSSGAL